MSVASEASEAVLHYKRKLSRHLDDDTPDIVLHCLDKLAQIPVNISILQDTGIGKVVNHLKKSDNADESIIEKARAIVQKWKDIVANEEEAMRQKEAATASPDDDDEDHDDNDDDDVEHEAEESAESDAGSPEDEEDVDSDPPPVLLPEPEVTRSSSKYRSKSESGKSEEPKKSKVIPVPTTASLSASVAK